MVCPKCGEDYEQRLQCPRCHVRLAFEPRSRPEVIENPWARRDQWQNTYWGRVLVGLLLAQGLYYGLRQLLTAGLMASGDDGAKDVWTTLFGLVLGQALQAFGLLAGAVLTGAGQRRAFVLGAMVGAWNGILFVVMQRLHATILTPVALYGLPLLQIAFGAIGGTIGGLIWRPSPTLTAPVAPAPAAAATSALALRGRKWSLFDGPTAWGRVLLGVAVAVSGAIWSKVILDFVLESAHGRLSIAEKRLNHSREHLSKLAVLAARLDAAGGLSAIDKPGTLTPVEYRQLIADLVNYLDYMAEPARNTRIHVGMFVLLFLGLLFAFAYWTKREYWKDVH